MFGTSEQVVSQDRGVLPRFALSHWVVAGASFFIELIVIVTTAVVTGIGYHFAAYSSPGPLDTFAAIGALTGLGYALTFLIREEYGVENALEGRRSSGRSFLVWNLAFVALAVIGFLSKSTQFHSRAWLLLFYVTGFVVTLLLNAALYRALTKMIATGRIRRRRLMIVATDGDLARTEQDVAADASGLYVVARVALPHLANSPEDIEQALEAAVGNARALGIEDVIISATLSQPNLLVRTVTAFSALPVAIHLNTSGLLGRLKNPRVARFGRATALSLTRAPLNALERATKRWFDVIVSATALVLLAPLFAIIALLIKLDSSGPVFFRQRRRGYNREEFRIWKFRTMRTLDDGDVIKQATRDDDRVTRLGRILRKASLDELPQLMNVLKGEMSLVGPRPHAIAHDQFFEKRIEDYPRRLNVKPGITGWAQVNGFRGATGADHDMKARVDHDLFYIDNCSIGFDLYILVLTVISPKASRNAH